MTKPTLRAVSPREETGAERAVRMETEAAAAARQVVKEWLLAQEETRGLALAVSTLKNLAPGITQEADSQARSLEDSRKRVAAILGR